MSAEGWKAGLCRFVHRAMATEFEVVIALDEGVDKGYAGQAAQAVFAEIDRLEDELSRFRPMSDISRINQLKAGERTPAGLATMDCLTLALAVQEATGGAFDVSVGPLMGIFRNGDGTPRTPQPEELIEAKKRVGRGVFELDDTGFVTSLADGLTLDLGAVGKGYALDQGAALLAAWGVPRALLNAGDSTLLGMQPPQGQSGWPVTVGNAVRRVIHLNERAVSGSGFQVRGAHIMNPRTLEPLPVKEERVWACAPTAALSDALSTAFAVMSEEEIKAFCARVPEVEAVL